MMEVRNKTILTQDEFIKGLIYGSKKSQVRAYLTLCGSILLTALAIVNFIFKKSPTAILLIVMGVFLVGLSLFILFATPFLLKKNNTYFQNGVEYNYVFKDETVFIETIVNGKTHSQEFKYQDLYRVTLNKDLILIFIDNATVFCCKRDAFLDDEQELIKILIPLKVKKNKRK